MVPIQTFLITQIGETLKLTPLKWLPVLSNITFPKIQREHTLIIKWIKVVKNLKLPIHTDLRTVDGRFQLKSRKPPWITANELLLEKEI